MIKDSARTAPIDPWSGFTEEYRARYPHRRPLTAMATKGELKLLAAAADELAEFLYREAVQWGDDPVVCDPDSVLDEKVLPRLPRCTDRQDQAWRIRMARAFADLAADITSGLAPVARCHAEDIALILSCRHAHSAVENALEFSAEKDEDQDAAGMLADWYPGLGRISLKKAGRGANATGRGHYTYQDFEEDLTGEAEAYLLWNQDDGLEHPDHPCNGHMIREDLRPDRWFDTFGNTVPRDPARGYPDDVLSAITDHARHRLDLAAAQDTLGPEGVEAARAMDAMPRDCGCGSRCCPGPHGPGMASPAEQRPLGEVRASTFLRSGWREQVWTETGEILRTKHYQRWNGAESTQNAWDLGEAVVLSDVPEVAIDQLRRYLPDLAQHGREELVEIYWARPTVPEEFVAPQWFRVGVWKIEERSTGPRDTPWLRVTWAGGVLAGMALTDVVAIRKATGTTLTPVAASDQQPVRKTPTWEDIRPRSDEDDELDLD